MFVSGEYGTNSDTRGNHTLEEEDTHLAFRSRQKSLCVVKATQTMVHKVPLTQSSKSDQVTQEQSKDSLPSTISEDTSTHAYSELHAQFVQHVNKQFLKHKPHSKNDDVTISPSISYQSAAKAYERATADAR